MGVLLDDIPGLRSAVARAEEQERALRDLAFLDVPVAICGVEVQQFRPRHYQHLLAVHSPFLTGGRARMLDALTFLWIVSTAYPQGGEARSFAAAIAPKLPRLKGLQREIYAYVAAAMMDRRKGGRPSDSSPIACVVAHLVDEFADGYGWAKEVTIETPYAALHQLQRLMDRRAAAEAGRRMAFENLLSTAVERAVIQNWRASQKVKPGRKKPAKRKGAK